MKKKRIISAVLAAILLIALFWIVAVKCSSMPVEETYTGSIYDADGNVEADQVTLWLKGTMKKEAFPVRGENTFHGEIGLNRGDQTDIFPDQELVFLKVSRDREVHYWTKIYIYLEDQADRVEYQNDRFGYVDVGTLTIDNVHPTKVSIQFSDEYCIRNGLETGSELIVSSRAASTEEG